MMLKVNLVGGCSLDSLTKKVDSLDYICSAGFPPNKWIPTSLTRYRFTNERH